MSGHVDLDALADLLVGEGDETQVRHLAGCAGCSSALDDLERAQEPVRLALATLPAPQVPGDLAARLDAALLRARDDLPHARVDRPGRREGRPPRPGDASPDDASPDDASPDDASGHRPTPPTVLPLRRGGRPAAALVAAALLAVAAVAVGVLAVSAGVVALTRRGPGDTAATSSSALARASPPTAAAQGGATDSAAGVPTSSSNTDFADPGALAVALPGLLGAPRAVGGGAPAPTLQQQETAADPLARLRDPVGRAGCLAGLSPAAPDGIALALDYARYAGAPALVAVLPATVAGQVEIVVVGAACRPGAPAVLFSTRLPAPP